MGSVSSMTWYWFNCVYMVLIWRWPKASYRVLSMVEGVMPKREAVARSMVTDSATPPNC